MKDEHHKVYKKSKEPMKKQAIKICCFLIIVLSFLGLLIPPAYGQKTWYLSSTTGNDNNSGLSPSAPLKSLNRLQQLFWWPHHQGQTLSRGDTIAFMRGDTFRVPFIGNNGQPIWGLYFGTPLFRQEGAPIVLTTYGKGSNKPVFTGTWNLGSLKGTVIKDSPIVKIYKPLAPWDTLTAFRLFYKGKPMVLAREPDISGPWNVVQSMWLIDSVKAQNLGDPDTIYSSAISDMSGSFFEGANLWSAVSGYSWICTKPVLSKKNDWLTIPSASEYGLYRGNRFIVENKLAYLDTPGEWYYDDQTDTLYLYPVSSDFNPSDYEVIPVQKRPSGIPRGLSFSVSYDTLPDNPVQNIVVKDLSFAYFPIEAIRLAGAKNVTIDNCYFYENALGVWNFLGTDLYVTNNVFRNLEVTGIRIYGRTVNNVPPGHPKTLSRRIWVENNDIRYTGLGPRWNWQTLLDTITFTLEDTGIEVGYGIDSVFVRKNRIDSVSQAGIFGNLYYWRDTIWYKNYPGKLPYVIEKNYITNFCMDFSDCGGIKIGFLNKNAIIRNNILDKRNNRDKRHQANYRFSLRHDGGAGLGLYSDVHQEGIRFSGNTVIGADVGIANYGGDWNVLNIMMDSNLIYNSTTVGIDLVMGPGHTANNCSAINNTLFTSKPGWGLIYMYDGDSFTNNPGVVYTDSLQELNNNRYFNPNGTALYWRSRPGRKIDIYGYHDLLQTTGYEKGPDSRWGWWAKYKSHWWDSAVVVANLTSNPTLSGSLFDLPFARFGEAQLQIVVPNTPTGERAVLAYCPPNATQWSGIRLKDTEPLLADTLSPFGVYRFQMVYTANKKTDFAMGVPFWTWHPTTGDNIWAVDYFSLPVREPYTWDSIAWRHEPRLYQRRARPEITLRPGDSLWIKYYSWDEIDPTSVPPLTWYYPIYYNASDNYQTSALPANQVYLTDDSVLVSESITLAPWQSKILIWVGTSPTTGQEVKGIATTDAIVYPNPARDYLKVLVREAGDYEIYALTGQLMQRGEVKGEGAENILNMGDWAEGIYLLRIRNKKGQERLFKIVRLD